MGAFHVGSWSRCAEFRGTANAGLYLTKKADLGFNVLELLARNEGAIDLLTQVGCAQKIEENM